MSKNLYMHFFIEHVYGHHKHVATPLDGATARLGQSLYSFIPQSIKHTWVNSWKYEVNRLSTPWTLYNRHLWFLAVEAALTVAIWYGYGVLGLAFFLAQAALSVCELEIINYVEHYGLLRKEVAPGVYEPVGLKHSWNAPQALQNIFLFKLQRHSDHHENPLKPYQSLCSYETSPQLPCGYGVCILASLFSSVWFSIIDPLALQANKTGAVSDQDLKKGELVLRSFVVTQAILLTIAIVLV
jgi:alkane 1-monooxygenase